MSEELTDEQKAQIQAQMHQARIMNTTACSVRIRQNACS